MIAPGVSRSLQIRPLNWSKSQLSYFILFHFVSFLFEWTLLSINVDDFFMLMVFFFQIFVAASREITFKTDPENGDYELETGASRNFESWTDKKATEDEHNKARYVLRTSTRSENRPLLGSKYGEP